jgi:hypothetical protein
MRVTDLRSAAAGAAVVLLASGGLGAPAAAQSNDQIIVPGERVGSVRLGMSEGELYSALGDPQQTIDMGRGWLEYDYADKLRVTVGNGRVVNIAVAYGATGYQTAEGVRVGGSALSARALLGPPPLTKIFKAGNPWVTAYCYAGITITSQPQEGIISIGVSSPDRTAANCR